MDQISIGVDIGKTGHYVVALNTAGDKIRAHELANTQPGIDELVVFAREHDAGIVVDQPTGGAALLIQACWDAGVPIGYLHGLAMARAREFYEGEAKTDPKDAFVIADVAHTHPSRIVPLIAVPEERARLELLCGRDEDLRSDLTRTTNRLRALLSTHWPALETTLDKRFSSPAVLQMLVAYPDPTALGKLGKARLVKFLKTRRVRKPEALVEKIFEAISSQHTVVAGSATAGSIVSEVAFELERIIERREAISKEIEACFFALPEAAILLSLPGVGPRTGARMLVEIGDVARFSTPSKLASFAGLGPSDRQSGTSIRNAVPSRRGNHRLKNAMFLSAFASLRHPPSRTYYDRKRDQGKRHNEAVLCLARRRIDVLHAMLTRRELYRWSPPQTPDESAQAA